MTLLLTDAIRAMIGRTLNYRAPEELGRASIRYFALAVGADPSRWKDEAPPTLVCETNQLTGNAEPDADAYLGHAWDLPLPVPCHMIRGGNDYRFGRPVRPDDVITTTWELVDAVERIGTGGRPLLLVTARATYTADDGEWLATNTETLIYRPSESK